MTSRIQTLRSSTTQVVPAAGTRQPGELWVNFPDQQLGFIDAAKNAQRLVGVRFFSASANYAIGDMVVQAGAIYAANIAVTAGAFSPGQWTKSITLADLPTAYVLPTASTTVLGGVKIDGTSISISGGGVISAAGTVTVSASPPGAAQAGSLWFDTVGGQLYLYYNDGNSSQWVIVVNQNAAGAFLPLTGGTLTGPLILQADPAVALGAVTKQYADAQIAALPFTGSNRIINGDMRIDQRNNGASGIGFNAYTIDRWQYTASQASKGTWQRILAGSVATAGFPYYLSFTSSSAFSSAATDYFMFNQPIEADTISDFLWGTASAKPVTLSFSAQSSLAGTFGGSIKNYASTRSYPFSFSLPVANTWTVISVTIPGDTVGPWVMSGNAGAAYVCFDLGCGSNFRAAAGAWTGGSANGATGAVNVVATNGATFNITGVKLEIGSIATPFPQESLAKRMADCQRYFSLSHFYMSGYCTASGSFGGMALLPLNMRAAPTVTLADTGSANITGIGAVAQNNGTAAVRGSTTATGTVQISTDITASAEL